MRTNRRRQSRTRGVLPVRVRGKDASGVLFEGLAHTLDVTPTGARVGAIRHKLRMLDTVVVLFRQRRVEFSVVWTKLMDDRGEYQVGLQLRSQESDPWGMSQTAARAQSTAGYSTFLGAA